MTTRDLTPLRRKLAARYEAQGMNHPEVAAFAVSVRGRTGHDIVAFANFFGLDLAVVEAAETGKLPFEALPPAYQDHDNSI